LSRGHLDDQISEHPEQAFGVGVFRCGDLLVRKQLSCRVHDPRCQLRAADVDGKA
jgi:hypothetical protein